MNVNVLFIADGALVEYTAISQDVCSSKERRDWKIKHKLVKLWGLKFQQVTLMLLVDNTKKWLQQRI